jgi:hypothetical protein
MTPITIGDQKFVKDENKGWIDSKTKQPADKGLIRLLDSLVIDEPVLKKIRTKIDKRVEPVSINGQKFVYDVNHGWVDKKTKTPVPPSLQRALSNSVPQFGEYANIDLTAGFGIVGQAAQQKTKAKAKPKSGGGTLINTRNTNINKPLVAMINQLASIDGILKQRIDNQKIIAKDNLLATRESQVEAVNQEPQIDVIKPDAEKVSGSSAGLLALGGLALLTLDPVQEAIKSVIDGVVNAGKFITDIVSSINSAFTFLLDSNPTDPATVDSAPESKPSAPASAPNAQPVTTKEPPATANSPINAPTTTQDAQPVTTKEPPATTSTTSMVNLGAEKVGKLFGMLGSVIIKPGVPRDKGIIGSSKPSSSPSSAPPVASGGSTTPMSSSTSTPVAAGSSTTSVPGNSSISSALRVATGSSKPSSSPSSTPMPVATGGVTTPVSTSSSSRLARPVASGGSTTPMSGSSSLKPTTQATGNNGNIIQVNHSETGSGWGIAGANNARGIPIAFSKEGAIAFAKMMQDSNGIVKPSDVASSKRSVAYQEQMKKNGYKPAANSPHLRGVAMDIHGASNAWIRKNGYKYGWKPHDYSGTHGGHFTFGGAGTTPDEGSTSILGSMSKPVSNMVNLGAEKIGELFGMLGSVIIKPGVPRDKEDYSKAITAAAVQTNAEVAVTKTPKSSPVPGLPTQSNINKINGGATPNSATSADKNSVYYYLRRFGFQDLNTPEKALAR